jgi:hypothetical protein
MHINVKHPDLQAARPSFDFNPQITQSILAAQRIDWHIPNHSGIALLPELRFQ